jgi:C1A family cysteine protease
MTYGYRIDLENKPALLAGATDFRALTYSAPEEIDPRPWHRIENQGSMGSCQGHALSSVCEMAYHIATGQVTQFSPLFAYYASQKIDGLLGSDNGSTISGGKDCAMKYGQCPLDVMPYPNPVRYTGKIPQEAFEAAEPFKIRSHSVCDSYADVFAYLASGQGGVEIGISWGLQPVNGVVERFQSGGGGHAVSFLGYSPRKDSQGRNYLWLANSWGTDTWGVNGWAEVAPQAVDDMARHPHTVMIGLSDLTTPEVRNVSWAKTNPWR